MRENTYDAFRDQMQQIPGEDVKTYVTDCSSPDAVGLLASSLILNEHPDIHIRVVHIDRQE